MFIRIQVVLNSHATVTRVHRKEEKVLPHLEVSCRVPHRDKIRQKAETADTSSSEENIPLALLQVKGRKNTKRVKIRQLIMKNQGILR